MSDETKAAAPQDPGPPPATPELEKSAAHHEDAQVIGGFLEWLTTKGYVLAEWIKDGSDDALSPVWKPINDLLATYWGLNRNRMELERRELLAWTSAKHLFDAHQRAVNAVRNEGPAPMLGPDDVEVIRR